VDFFTIFRFADKIQFSLINSSKPQIKKERAIFLVSFPELMTVLITEEIHFADKFGQFANKRYIFANKTGIFANKRQFFANKSARPSIL